jgi:hypothetical protein
MDQTKRPQYLAATEGVLLNIQDVMNIVNIKIPTVNEAGVGSSPTAPANVRFIHIEYSSASAGA